MYQSILIPLDGSAFSEQALPAVEALARRAHAAVHLVQVHVPIVTTDVEGLPIGDLDPQADRDTWHRELAHLEQFRTQVANSGAGSVSAALLDGPVVPSLIHYQQTHTIDVTVMTTHGRGGFARFWLGSTADQLVRESVVPVLLQRPDEALTGSHRPTAWERILIPLDGSPEAEGILECVVAFGTLMDSSYTLLRVVGPVVVLGYAPVMYAAGAIEETQAQEYQAASVYLEQVADRLRRHDLHVETRVVAGQPVASAIVVDAEEHAIDVIALATHGRHGASRVLLGSTADTVVRGTHLPILVFHPCATDKRRHEVQHQAAEVPMPV